MGPVINSLHKYIKLSFKEGLKDGFVVNVQTNIQMRRWEQYYPAQPTNSDPKNRVIICMFGRLTLINSSYGFLVYQLSLSLFMK